MLRHVAASGRMAARATACVLAIAGSVELIFAAGFYWMGATLPQVLGLHLLITAAVAGALRALHGKGARDLQFFATLAFGFLGGFGAIVAAMALLRGQERRFEPHVPCAHAGDAERSAAYGARVVNGRAMCAGGSQAPVFAEIMGRGSADAQLDILGVLAQRYHPDFLPTLRAALTSPHLSVRASAAALVTALRLEMKERLAAAQAGLERAGGDASRELLDEAARCLQSGLCDAMQLKSVQAVAVASCRIALARGNLEPSRGDGYVSLLMAAGAHRELTELLSSSRLRLSGEARAAVLTSLMKAGRFDLVRNSLREPAWNQGGGSPLLVVMDAV